MVFEVNETYGYPLAKDRLRKYNNNKNENPKLKNNAFESRVARKEIAPVEVLPAGKEPRR